MSSVSAAHHVFLVEHELTVVTHIELVHLILVFV